MARHRLPLGLAIGSALTLIAPTLSFVPGLGIALIAIIGIAVAAGVAVPS